MAAGFNLVRTISLASMSWVHQTPLFGETVSRLKVALLERFKNCFRPGLKQTGARIRGRISVLEMPLLFIFVPTTRVLYRSPVGRQVDVSIFLTQRRPGGAYCSLS
jgi:hypothetical protein